MGGEGTYHLKGSLQYQGYVEITERFLQETCEIVHYVTALDYC